VAPQNENAGLFGGGPMALAAEEESVMFSAPVAGAPVSIGLTLNGAMGAFPSVADTVNAALPSVAVAGGEVKE